MRAKRPIYDFVVVVFFLKEGLGSTVEVYKLLFPIDASFVEFHVVLKRIIRYEFRRVYMKRRLEFGLTRGIFVYHVKFLCRMRYIEFGYLAVEDLRISLMFVFLR